MIVANSTSLKISRPSKLCIYLIRLRKKKRNKEGYVFRVYVDTDR